MTSTATVNYHVHKNERQAFELDAGGIVGNLISPELAATRVKVNDVRTVDKPLRFSEDGVEFAHLPSAVSDFSGDAWTKTYNRELEKLLTDRLGARDIVIFDHTVRVDDPEATRKPARNVHSDYSETGAANRLTDLVGTEAALEWEQGHYAFINIWRPIANPINSAPLGFIRPRSVDAADWILLDLIYPDRTGQIMGLAHNPDHEWLYQSKMKPDEVAYFNIYDNRGLPSVGHSALDMIEDPKVQTVRQSIESRTLIRY